VDTNGDDESEVADLKPRIQRPRSPRKAPAPRRSVAEMIGEPAESGAIAEEPAVAEPQHEAEAAGADEGTPRGLRRRRKQAQHRGDASLKAGVGRRPPRRPRHRAHRQSRGRTASIPRGAEDRDPLQRYTEL
jgi:hypothetical protein